MCKSEIDDSIFYSPDTIFHYTKVYTGLEKILYEKELRFFPLRYMHDPREYKEWSFGYAGSPDVENESKEILFKLLDRVNEVIKNDFKIGCFCANPVIDKNQFEIIRMGFARARMWSQYSENHAGLCFVFFKIKINGSNYK